MERLETDVIVVGGGGAGLRAAIEAADAGSRVTLVLKDRLGVGGATGFKVSDSSSFAAANGMKDHTDSPSEHLRDTIAAGLGMVDEEVAKVLTEEAISSFDRLREFGVRFALEPDGGYVISAMCYASHPRAYRTLNHGYPIIEALVEQVKRRPIRILENVMAVDLLVEGDTCKGVVGVSPDGTILAILAPATILAAGGAGQLWFKNMNPPDITGDGIAMGLRAGAILINMEFLQSGIGTVYPVEQHLISHLLWPLGPRLYNAEGEEFLYKYVPPDLTVDQVIAEHNHYPFTSRFNSKYLDIAIQSEILSGRGSPRWGVYLDFRGVTERNLRAKPASVQWRWQSALQFFRTRNVDLAREPIEVANHAQALNGGIRIGVFGDTSVAGLYAVGECAGGPHGADRLGGNMLAAAQVFGARAGLHAAQRARELGPTRVSDTTVRTIVRGIEKYWSSSGDLHQYELRRQLQRGMWEVMVIRSEAKLSATMELLDTMEHEWLPEVGLRTIHDRWKILELRNLIQVGCCICLAAGLRQESRGSHYREDYPYLDDKNWLKKILLQQTGRGLVHRFESAAPYPGTQATT